MWISSVVYCVAARIMSVLVTIPRRTFFESTTGIPLIPCSIMSLAAFVSGSSDPTVTGFGFIISEAVIALILAVATVLTVSSEFAIS